MRDGVSSASVGEERVRTAGRARWVRGLGFEERKKGDAYLLRRHVRVAAVHIVKRHLRLGLPVGCRRVGLDMSSIHRRRLPVILLVAHRMLSHRRIVWLAHVMRRLCCLCLGGLLLCLRRVLGAGAASGCGCSTFRVGSGLFTRNDVDQEVEHVRFCERGCDVRALEGASFVVFCVNPGAHCELGDENVASFGEEDGSFGRDHLDFRVRFHDFFYPCERKLVELVVMVFGLEGVDCLLPVRCEDLFGLALKTLVHLEDVQLGWFVIQTCFPHILPDTLVEL